MAVEQGKASMGQAPRHVQDPKFALGVSVATTITSGAAGL